MDEITAAPSALPDDVVLELLMRVPDAVTLFRCAAACKRWRGLIADQSFLRRRWAANASSFAGFFARERRRQQERDDDSSSPPIFVPMPRSAAGPAPARLPLTSFLVPDMAGLLAGAEALTARNGVLLVRLSPCVAGGGGPIRLAACNLIAGTCDVLPPLDSKSSSPIGYTVLTGEDYFSSSPPSHAPNYTTFFKVLILGLSHIRTGSSVIGHYNLRMFSSSSSSSRWRSRTNLGDFYITRCDDDSDLWRYMEHSVVVDRCGVTHYLLTKWPDKHRLPYYTVDMKGHVCVMELCLSSYEPAAETHLLALVSGEVSCFSMHAEESLRLERWKLKGDDGHNNLDWIFKGVMELKPPKKRRIDDVLWVWSGEKSNTLLIMDWELHAYLANLETGTMEDITGQFYNTVSNAVPIEIDWPALFMSRLGKHIC
ncbi:hypothetical protein D1007_41960 [Hordeum vulgare]|uniref:F-box domain-containing protein n=1 Tax=Hordeum vulgare subsp. vulgare TaxID=112509 RepID=A0A8I6YKG0_HORVV|nr:hypothetical protein D1007_41960 [Hordeum vulgare]